MDSHDFWTPKCKSCSKTRFESQNAFWSPQNIKKRRTRMPKCGLCDFGAKRAPTAPLERLGAFGPLRTPINVGHVCKSAKVIFCNFVFHFSKNKKVAKSHFRTFAYVYDVFCCSEGSESQSCVLSNLERLGAPKSPKSHFLIRVRWFCLFWEPQITISALLAIFLSIIIFGTPMGSEGGRSTNRPEG